MSVMIIIGIINISSRGSGSCRGIDSSIKRACGSGRE